MPEPTKTYNCQDQDSPSWQIRQQEAVNLLVRCMEQVEMEQVESAIPIIGDFGCGNCGIKRLLEETAPSDFKYYGYDIKPQSELATQIDLRQSFPSNMRFDAAVCLGLIEYMEDVRPFLSYLRENCQFVVLSYVYDSGAYSAEDIERLGWVNHFKKEEIDRLLKEIGFAWDDELILKEKYFLRLLY